MTPAINLVRKLNIRHQIHEYTHDANHTSYGLEAAEKMQVPAKLVFKTLVVALDDRSLAVAVVPVDRQLNMKLMAKANKSKKALMAEAHDVQRVTGYVLGGVSPLGQKKRLPTVIDSSAQNSPRIFVSAGRRGLEIELDPEDLKQLTQARFAEITQSC